MADCGTGANDDDGDVGEGEGHALVIYDESLTKTEGFGQRVPERLFCFARRRDGGDGERDQAGVEKEGGDEICLRMQQAWKPDGHGGTDVGFGATVYSASIVLSRWLHAHAPDLVRGKSVVELGCGPGLCGVVAGAVLGAQTVLLTDGDEASVALARQNCEQNGLGPDDTENGRVQVAKLWWGSADDVVALPIQPPFDVILAADVAAVPYEESYTALLAAFRDLSRDGSEILLAYQRRHHTEAHFFDLLRQEFGLVEEIEDHGVDDFKHLPISLFRMVVRR